MVFSVNGFLCYGLFNNFSSWQGCVGYIGLEHPQALISVLHDPGGQRLSAFEFLLVPDTFEKQQID